jgi:FAD dependent oxidoreductase TIGR03364
MAYDAIVIGAGIVGLAHAYVLAKEGRRVLVIERDDFAVGASVRNFGMIWVVGQPLGPRRELALRSQALWRELLEESGIWYRESGALHLAYAEDEMAVLTEFLVQAEDPTLGQLLTPAEVAKLSPGVRRDNLLGALYSRTELCVDPRTTVKAVAAHLALRYRVEFRYGANVMEIKTGEVRFTGGVAHADRIFVCAGPELRRLFPDLVKETGLRTCRLQMLRLDPPVQPVGPHLCAGLTLAHYANFRDCPSLPALKARYARQYPEHVAHGIHVLVAQHGDGSITVGDSHAYADSALPYQSAEVERLILSALDEFFPIEGLRVRERWEGSYLTHSDLPYFTGSPMPGVEAIACFGTGMTLAFGVADRVLA